MNDIMVLCKKCGNRVPASSLKLDLDERMVICLDCIKGKKIHKEIQEEVLHKKESIGGAERTKQVIQNEETLAKIPHKCTSCGYKFKIDPETRNPKNCPYCNARVLSF